MTNEHAELMVVPSEPPAQEPFSYGNRKKFLWWTIGISSAVLIILCLILVAVGHASHANGLDQLKVALLIAAGVGGGGGFVLKIRSQMVAEKKSIVDKLHNDRVANSTEQHNERIAKNTEDEARNRRITELFNTSLTQIGSSNFAERIGGLYAMEVLGQTYPEWQQRVTDIICAYLRAENTKSGSEKIEEDEVRKTAQNILFKHISNRNGPDFWPELSVNLARSHLKSFRLLDGSVRSIDLTDSTTEGLIKIDNFTVKTGILWQNANIGRLEMIKVESHFQISNRSEVIGGATLGAPDIAGSAEFINCKFKGLGSTLSLQVRDLLRFYDCVFSGLTLPILNMLENDQLDVHSRFDHCEFYGSFDLKFSKIERKISFTRSNFFDHLSLLNEKEELISNTVLFRGCAFSSSSNFGDLANLHDGFPGLSRRVIFEDCIISDKHMGMRSFGWASNDKETAEVKVINVPEEIVKASPDVKTWYKVSSPIPRAELNPS
jgi:hypothetical protein